VGGVGASSSTAAAATAAPQKEQAATTAADGQRAEVLRWAQTLLEGDNIPSWVAFKAEAVARFSAADFDSAEVTCKQMFQDAASQGALGSRASVDQKTAAASVAASTPPSSRGGVARGEAEEGRLELGVAIISPNKSKSKQAPMDVSVGWEQMDAQ
jgi:hypothetical protein